MREPRATRWMHGTSILMACLAILSIALVVRAQSVAEFARRSVSYANPTGNPGHAILSAGDEQFLDDLQRRGIQFYIDYADPVTGLMPDRGKADGSGAGDVASVASVGFGLTSLCIGAERGWVPREQAYERCLRVLKFLRQSDSQQHGHFYHFLEMRTGKRAWNCEVSNIDTALLMAGALTVRQYFPNTELAVVADDLYRRVEWPWMLTKDNTLSMGWRPEHAGDVEVVANDGETHQIQAKRSGGFIRARWDHYSEGAPLILLLGIGSKTHPLPPGTWQAWRREPVFTYAGLTYVQCGPLFTHQYPQCWFDLRGLRDSYLNYFQNSQLATLAQRQWAIDELSKKYSTYGSNTWGISASDSAQGYRAWGGPPTTDEIDGSVVPCAAAGSLAFQPRLCLDALLEMKRLYGVKAWQKYGFVDAFNPATGWYDGDVIGIDVGPGVIMAENCRSGFVWKTFMSSPEAQAAVKAAGLVSAAASEVDPMSSLQPREAGR